MFLIAKLVLLALYAAALAGLAGLLAPGLAGKLQNIALIIVAIHVIEALVMFKHRGPLAASVLLTLLFGLLHWKPLADEQARARETERSESPTP
jgi:fatty acid desaturase